MFCKKLTFLYVFILTALVTKSGFAQQDVQFSQYIFNGLALNPGYAGYKELTNINLMYRSQWTGLQGAPQTFSASIDGVSADKKMGFGFQAINDQLGAQSNLTAFATYAYRLELAEDERLSLGLSAGMAQYGIDGSKLTTIDPEYLNTLNRSVIHPDINFGIFYASLHYFWGISANDLLTSYRSTDPAYLTIQRERHYYLQGGGIYEINEGLSIKPSVIIKEDFKSPTNIDFNTFLLIGKQLWLGVSYRTGVAIFNRRYLQRNLTNNDAVSALVEFNFSQHWRIGYSYDYSTTRIQSVSDGSHELSISYLFFPKTKPMLTPRYF